MKRNKTTFKTMEEHQAIIDKNYKAMFFLLSLSLLLSVAFLIQVING
jgi:hypothetical protein